jgi:NAD(P)H-dependent FMN reductase
VGYQLKYIISGTNRPGSRSGQVAQIIKNLYAQQGEAVGVIDLSEVGLDEVNGAQYAESQPAKLKAAVAQVNSADGLIIVCPEYNGSMPGALKYFIDHWKYPESFEFRPVCLIGIGGQFGALRAVEHLQGTLGYRNVFLYPERVFITMVWNVLKNGQIESPEIMKYLSRQAEGFSKFVAALKGAGLDANTRAASAGHFL